MIAYLKKLSVISITLLIAVMVIGIAIDPYGFWGVPKIDGINLYKPAATKHLLQVKLRQYERVQPRSLVAGNSRVAIGMDPNSTAWPSSSQPVYNLGLPGFGAVNTIKAVLDAIDRHQPETIYLGLDLLDFRVDEPDWREHWSAWRPQGVEPAVTDLRLYVELLLSLDVLLDSYRTIAEQQRAYPRNLSDQGFIEEYDGIAATEGYAAMFEQRLGDSLENAFEGPKAVRWSTRGGSASWDALERLAEVAHDRGIKLVLFTYPYHAELLLAFRYAGLWGGLEDFKRTLAEFAERKGVMVWDFAKLNDRTQEFIPSSKPKANPMRWYWDVGHFKSAFGDDLINVMNGGPSEASYALPLAPANVDQALGVQRRKLEEMLGSKSQAVDHVDTALARLKRSAAHSDSRPALQDQASSSRQPNSSKVAMP